ncbi:MAG TPA: SRPBCC domain-containing protein [Xanthobacteraceae bacterium]
MLDQRQTDFVISRLFDAPREMVWKAFTEPERLNEWFGPKGVKVVSATLDLRPGGTFHYSMRTPDGRVMWGKFVYREIIAPTRLVWVNSFSDAAGGLTRHPLSPSWPLEMLTTVTFDAPHVGQTGVTIRWSALNATEAEQRTFDAGHDSMRQGWSGTFDQLAAYLASAR